MRRASLTHTSTTRTPSHPRSLPQLYIPPAHNNSNNSLYTGPSPPHMASPGPSATDIQAHLYNSFLDGKTADVVLRVRGSWHALYKLHRVVLIQAGFFQSLFTAGFVESVQKYRGHRLRPNEVEIVFDDPNITRAAFEICISRLYGGGPPLHISPNFIPSPSHPLTTSFPSPPSFASNATPSGHHPATPRFLLSLLATSVYLSIPSVAAQALNAILNSVGPYTVMRYLGFAIGKGIGEEDEYDHGKEAAVGLERVAEIVKYEEDIVETLPPLREEDKTPHDAEDLSKRLDYIDIKKEDPSENEDSSSEESSSDDQGDGGPSYYYGALSSKVGEVSACWLARWGRDMLSYEERLVDTSAHADPPTPGPSRRRAITIPSTPRYQSQSSSVFSDLIPSAAKDQNIVIPVIWRRGGLDANWVRALVCSDFLFVKGERERYDLARGVVEMRRKERADEAEEREWEEMFGTAIFYQNMPFDDLMHISRDVSPTTGRPFVSLQVLQAALWSQSLLRNHITARPSSPPSSPSQREKELGITVTTADILSSVHDQQKGAQHDKAYFPIPADSSVRIGDTTALENASMDELFALPAAEPADPKKVSRLSTSESTFFGLLSSSSQQRSASSCVAHDSTGKSRWSPYPPFRFGVEFWDIDELKEKSRLHSQTVWYAGSLFNVYVQVVRKKGVPGVQLGVYLHRQSSVDPVPPPSAPSPLLIVRGGSSAGHTRRTSTPNASVQASASLPTINANAYTPQSPTSRSTTPVSVPGHATSQSSYPSTVPGSPTAVSSTSYTMPSTSSSVMPSQPYRDPRSSISAYFTISCASATGASLTQFTSAPDVFSVSQSWGWKSSSLRTEEYLEVGGGDAQAGPPGREVSLRATVVLGLV